MKKYKSFYNGALFAERYIIPALIIYFTFKNIAFLASHSVEIYNFVKKIISGKEVLAEMFFISTALRVILSTIFNLLVAGKLILRKRPYKKPDRLREIAIPLVGVYFPLLYNFIQYLPQKYNHILAPLNTLFPLLFIGLFFCIIGLLITIISIFNMKSSFSIFVEVGDIVSRGMYRYMRHPVYFGYFISWVGLCLIRARLYTVIFAAMYISIILIRARMEEEKLAEHSLEYRIYQKKTPFF
jgi:protein-S-isoprenylcysteine O-methyltransferase Ste14